jgi:AraC family transcriptional regulator
LRELGLLLRDEARRLHTENPNYPVTIARLMAMHLVQHHAVRKTASARRGGLSPTRFSRVKELIQLRLGENLTLDEMARTAGLSVFHFSRVFRQTTGMSPFQYVTTCRINHAKQLLLHPFARIGDVALECGFCDQAHLTRQFKRFVGITPAAYVRSLGHRHLAR